MNVTSKQVEGATVRYTLDNGDAYVRTVGRVPFYQFANGQTYSARNGRHSGSTLIPAQRAAATFDRRSLGEAA